MSVPITCHPLRLADPRRRGIPIVENADALYAEYAARSVEFTGVLGDTPWQSREFVVKDCDGRLLAFGMSAEG